MIAGAVSNTYRDDQQAAQARAEALQRENAELKAALIRARAGEDPGTFAPPPTPMHPPGSQRAFTVLVSGTLIAVSALGAVAAMRPTRITVVTVPPESIVAARATEFPEQHTPTSGRFVQRPPSPTTAFPNQTDVFMAVQSARPAVERCFHERWEASTATIEFASDGSVASVSLAPSGAQDGCIEAEIRRMRLPSFGAPTWRTVQTFRARWTGR